MSSQTRRPFTILLTDYEPRSIARIRSLLRRCGFRTVVARDGTAAITTFQEQKPDLALIQDIVPKKDGFEICRCLRDSPSGGEVPIILLVSGGRGKSQALRLCGCSDHLKKPFTDEELIERLRAWLPVQSGMDPPSDGAPRPVALEEADIALRLDAILSQRGPAARRTDPARRGSSFREKRWAPNESAGE